MIMDASCNNDVLATIMASPLCFSNSCGSNSVSFAQGSARAGRRRRLAKVLDLSLFLFLAHALVLLLALTAPHPSLACQAVGCDNARTHVLVTRIPGVEAGAPHVLWHTADPARNSPSSSASPESAPWTSSISVSKKEDKQTNRNSSGGDDGKHHHHNRHHVVQRMQQRGKLVEWSPSKCVADAVDGNFVCAAAATTTATATTTAEKVAADAVKTIWWTDTEASSPVKKGTDVAAETAAASTAPSAADATVSLAVRPGVVGIDAISGRVVFNVTGITSSSAPSFPLLDNDRMRGYYSDGSAFVGWTKPNGRPLGAPVLVRPELGKTASPALTDNGVVVLASLDAQVSGAVAGYLTNGVPHASLTLRDVIHDVEGVHVPAGEVLVTGGGDRILVPTRFYYTAVVDKKNGDKEQNSSNGGSKSMERTSSSTTSNLPPRPEFWSDHDTISGSKGDKFKLAVESTVCRVFAIDVRRTLNNRFLVAWNTSVPCWPKTIGSSRTSSKRKIKSIHNNNSNSRNNHVSNIANAQSASDQLTAATAATAAATTVPAILTGNSGDVGNQRLCIAGAPNLLTCMGPIDAITPPVIRMTVPVGGEITSLALEYKPHNRTTTTTTATASTTTFEALATANEPGLWAVVRQANNTGSSSLTRINVTMGTATKPTPLTSFVSLPPSHNTAAAAGAAAATVRTHKLNTSRTSSAGTAALMSVGFSNKFSDNSPTIMPGLLCAVPSSSSDNMPPLLLALGTTPLGAVRLLWNATLPSDPVSSGQTVAAASSTGNSRRVILGVTTVSHGLVGLGWAN